MKLFLSFCLAVLSLSTMAQKRTFDQIAVDSINLKCMTSISKDDYIRMESISDGSDDYQVHSVFFKNNLSVVIEESRESSSSFIYLVLRVNCGN